jgi:hypothetical protein
VVAKLAAGVSTEQAAEDASRAAQRIWEAYPAAVKSQVQLRARLIPLAEQVVTGSRTPVLLFAGSALLLLLIGCANVSNLLLTRLNTRRHEMVLPRFYPGVPARWRSPDLGTAVVPVMPVSFRHGDRCPTLLRGDRAGHTARHHAAGTAHRVFLPAGRGEQSRRVTSSSGENLLCRASEVRSPSRKR